MFESTAQGHFSAMDARQRTSLASMHIHPPSFLELQAWGVLCFLTDMWVEVWKVGKSGEWALYKMLQEVSVGCLQTSGVFYPPEKIIYIKLYSLKLREMEIHLLAAICFLKKYGVNLTLKVFGIELCEISHIYPSPQSEYGVLPSLQHFPSCYPFVVTPSSTPEPWWSLICFSSPQICLFEKVITMKSYTYDLRRLASFTQQNVLKVPLSCCPYQ